MFCPRLEEDQNTRTLTDTWLGYNHNYKIGNGEFFDMENLTSDNFPLMTPRKVRPLLYETKEIKIRGILYSDGKLTYLVGNTLHYGLNDYDLTEAIDEADREDDSRQTLVRFGSYILIYPLGVYFNCIDPSDFGNMNAWFRSGTGVTITYRISDSNGNDYGNVTEGRTAPEEPTDGMYWLNTTPGSEGLNMYDGTKKSWTPVATTYIRMEVPGANFTSIFNEGDTVTLNSAITDINEGSMIQSLGDEYMVFIGVMNSVVKTSTTSDVWQLLIERKIPQMDYVCTDKNRVWGCRYGYTAEGELINEIYASKLGDFRNFYSFQGLSTDSYTLTVGEPGNFTGCISYGGYPTFFKENVLYKIYGNMPEEYQVIQTNCRGVQDGSYRSLAIVGEYLFYKSASDICVYDGSTPQSISQALGRGELFYEAVGGGTLNKYQVIMQNAAGRRYWFVYDMEHGIWEREDAEDIQGFTGSENGQMFACTNYRIYGLGNTDSIAYTDKLIGEEYVEWWAQTGELGFEYPDFKYVSKITVRAYIPYRSEVQIKVSYDDRPFEEVATLRGREDITTQSISIMPMRCDRYRLMFKGHGECRIYSMATTLETGSEDYGY